MKKTALLAATAMTAVRAFDNTPAPAATPAATKPAVPRVEPVLTVAFKGIPLPVKKNNRGSESKYPFDTLTEVGMAFGVKNKTAAQLSSIASNANKKANVKRTDENGNVVFKMAEMKDANGAVIGHTPTTEPEMVQTAKYQAVDVDDTYKKAIKGTPLEGSTALVFRIDPAA